MGDEELLGEQWRDGGQTPGGIFGPPGHRWGMQAHGRYIGCTSVIPESSTGQAALETVASVELHAQRVQHVLGFMLRAFPVSSSFIPKQPCEAGTIFTHFGCKK